MRLLSTNQPGLFRRARGRPETGKLSPPTSWILNWTTSVRTDQRAPRVEEMLGNAYARIKFGHGLNQETDLGPLIHTGLSVALKLRQTSQNLNGFRVGALTHERYGVERYRLSH